jgi:TonB family protein
MGIKSQSMKMRSLTGLLFVFLLVSTASFANSPAMNFTHDISNVQLEDTTKKREPLPPPSIPMPNQIVLTSTVLSECGCRETSFPGGSAKMREYIRETAEYPESDLEKGIGGKVYMKFAVDEEGVISDVEVARGVSPTLDFEAMRIICSMPNWIPETSHHGEAIKVSVRLPITFTLVD